jgi:nucleoside phosphorylase
MQMRRAVIITALPIERTAVIEHLREVAEEPPLRGSIYRRGTFDDRSEPWNVIVAEVGAGNEGAAAEADRILARYTPEVALFVGIAGGVKDLAHGDVVAATKVYHYESGKDRDDHFETRPDVELPAHPLLERARYEAGEPHWKERIKASEPPTASPPPEAKLGPIAAGPKVLASTRTATFQFIRQHYGDAVAVEMEGHGFLRAVRMNHPVPGLVVRGISDCVGDKNPDDDRNWQPIAARHAAAFAFQVLAKYTVPTGGSASAVDERQIDRLASEFLRAQRESLRRVRILDLGRALDLADGYVEVTVSPFRGATIAPETVDPDIEKGLHPLEIEQAHAVERFPVCLRTAVAANRLTVLIGDPGAGKSTQLRHLCMAPLPSIPQLVPIFVAVRDLSTFDGDLFQAAGVLLCRGPQDPAECSALTAWTSWTRLIRPKPGSVSAACGFRWSNCYRPTRITGPYYLCGASR